jgi:O-antigen ligase
VETAQILQLAVAVLFAVVVFVVASGAKATRAIGLVLILIPFQLIETQYGSTNVVFTYVLAAALLSGGRLRAPFMASLLLIVFAYLASLSQTDPSMYISHATYIFQFVSGLVVFVLAYNFARDVKETISIVNVLIAMNVLVIIYCLIQLWVGPGGQFIPFGNPSVTAEYLVLMALVMCFDLIHSAGWRRRMLLLLLVTNLILLVATGNRGGFLVLMVAFPLFLFGFRRELGIVRVIQFSLGGLVALALASIVTVAYTDFGRLFERLQTVTEMDNGVPATRSEAWPTAFEKIRQHPWFGEGPRFAGTQHAMTGDPLESENPYPHDLYLFLLRTVGIFGLTAVLAFFVRAWIKVHRAASAAAPGSYRAGFLRIGSLLFLCFLIDQIKIEFPRNDTIDYVHFVFALVGVLVGVAARPADGSPAATIQAASA